MSRSKWLPQHPGPEVHTANARFLICAKPMHGHGACFGTWNFHSLSLLQHESVAQCTQRRYIWKGNAVCRQSIGSHSVMHARLKVRILDSLLVYLSLVLQPLRGPSSECVRRPRQWQSLRGPQHRELPRAKVVYSEVRTTVAINLICSACHFHLGALSLLSLIHI